MDAADLEGSQVGSKRPKLESEAAEMSPSALEEDNADDDDEMARLVKNALGDVTNLFDMVADHHNTTDLPAAPDVAPPATELLEETPVGFMKEPVRAMRSILLHITTSLASTASLEGRTRF